MKVKFAATYTKANAPRNIIDLIEHHKVDELIVGTFYNAAGQFDGITISADDDYNDETALGVFLEHVEQMTEPFTNADLFIARGDLIVYLEFVNEQ